MALTLLSLCTAIDGEQHDAENIIAAIHGLGVDVDSAELAGFMYNSGDDTSSTFSCILVDKWRMMQNAIGIIHDFDNCLPSYCAGNRYLDGLIPRTPQEHS